MAAAGGRVAPIQIRAQFLKDMGPLGPVGDTAAFIAMPDDAATAADCHKVRRGHWREKDLQRAIGAAKRSGLTDFRVEIAPDGTIAIVVGQQQPKRASRRHN